LAHTEPYWRITHSDVLIIISTLGLRPVTLLSFTHATFYIRNFKNIPPCYSNYSDSYGKPGLLLPVILKRIIASRRNLLQHFTSRHPVHHNSFHKEKIQQGATVYQNFIIPYLYKAQHVSGNTPPIIRSLKLHRQPLVFRMWNVVERVVGGRCQAHCA
jgi:hypothetical protein